MSVSNRMSRFMQRVAASYFNIAERTWGYAEKTFNKNGTLQLSPDLVAACVNMALACEIALKSQLPDEDKFKHKHDLKDLRSYLPAVDTDPKTDQTRYLVKMYLGINDEQFDQMLERNRNVFMTRRYYYENDNFEIVEYGFLMVFAASLLEPDGYHYKIHEGNYLEIPPHVPFCEDELHDFPRSRLAPENRSKRAQER